MTTDRRYLTEEEDKIVSNLLASHLDEPANLIISMAKERASLQADLDIRDPEAWGEATRTETLAKKTDVKKFREQQVAAVERIIQRDFPVTMNESDYESLRKLQALCGENAHNSGFDDNETEALQLIQNLIADGNENLATFLENAINSQNLMLVVEELSEANDQLRKGRRMNEEYFNGAPGKELKPEGIPSELADVLIRILHIAAYKKIDLATVIRNKLAYNTTRGKMYGGLKF